MTKLLGLLGLLALPLLGAGERRIVLDLDHPLGPLNREILGTAKGSENPATIELLRQARFPHIRIDASLEEVGSDCARPPDFTKLDARIRSVRAAGAEPLVILSYTPACMSRYPGPSFGGQPDPTKHPPRDRVAYAALVRATVERAATTPGLDVRWFEAWNEPDVPQFFQGTILEYLDLYETIAGAVEDVRGTTGLDLKLGGPAAFVPDPLLLVALLDRVVSRGLRLDFVSWHWYANYPLIGPILGEPPLTIPPLTIENPLLDPSFYGDQVRLVRALVAAAWSRRTDGAARPFLWLDEWNLDAGHDLRHDTTEAAAFAASAVRAMLDAGLDRSSFFTATDLEDPNFNQGMFFPDGTPKPVYAFFRLWSRLEELRLAARTTPAASHVGAIASRSPDGKRLTALLYNWRPLLGRTEQLRIEIAGLAGRSATGTLHRLPSGASTGFDGDLVSEPVDTMPLRVSLENASIALLELEIGD